MKPLLPALALLFASASPAYAFPPCPLAPLTLAPLTGGAGSNEPGSATAPWFQSNYAVVDPAGMLEPNQGESNNTGPGTGECNSRNALPVPLGNVSPGQIRMNPQYAPVNAFGILAFPYMPSLGGGNLQVQYQLDFNLDNAPLQQGGDWIDLIQIDFVRAATPSLSPPQQASRLYRIRKFQPTSGPAVLKVIVSRQPDANGKDDTIPTDNVVAAIPLPTAFQDSPIALRWTQSISNGANGRASTGQPNGTTLELLIGFNVVYSTTLNDEWTDTLSMGLLDYNIPNNGAYSGLPALIIDDARLSATTL